MTFDKISLTFFDVLSYLLPGYILLFALSVIESSFFGTSLLAFSHLESGWFFSSVVAYFLGQTCHRLGSKIKSLRPNWFENHEQRLIRPVYYYIRSLLAEMHPIEFKEEERLHSFETYLMAESYIVASGKNAELDSLLTREGFHKTSMVAFGFTTIAFFSTLFVGGTRIQVNPTAYTDLGLIGTLICLSVLLIMTISFWQGFVFYNRLKINNILMLAMTLRSLDKEKLKK